MLVTLKGLRVGVEILVHEHLLASFPTTLLETSLINWRIQNITG